MGLVLSLAIEIADGYASKNLSDSLIKPLLIGLILAIACVMMGWAVMRYHQFPRDLSYKQGAILVILTWLLAALIGSIVFFLSGFPDPHNLSNYSMFTRWVDSYFEAMSGFSTTGSTILPSVEVFSRGILFFRSLTHWIGGMGIVYMYLTLTQALKGSEKHKILSAEMETPDKVEFENESAVYRSGVNFLKIFSLLTVMMFVCLIVSGHYYREIPYPSFADNLFDAIIHSLSTMGTGGFSNYNLSAAGLLNPVSETIIAVFMLLQGVNLGLLFTAIFKHRLTDAEHNSELRIYLFSVFIITLGVYFNLLRVEYYSDALTTFRHAFFSVTSIVSTTGLASTDFSLWPTGALGLIFLAYIMGGSVGSTSGGLKVKRHLILIKFSLKEVHSYVVGGNFKSVDVDGVTYNSHDVAIIIVNMFFYFLAIGLGTVAIMTFSRDVNFTSAIMAALSSAGNIGPGFLVGSINNGPIGNYAGFNEAAKIIMIPLMLLGRIGFLNLLILLNKYED